MASIILHRPDFVGYKEMAFNPVEPANIQMRCGLCGLYYHCYDEAGNHVTCPHCHPLVPTLPPEPVAKPDESCDIIDDMPDDDKIYSEEEVIQMMQDLQRTWTEMTTGQKKLEVIIESPQDGKKIKVIALLVQSQNATETELGRLVFRIVENPYPPVKVAESMPLTAEDIRRELEDRAHEARMRLLRDMKPFTYASPTSKERID